MSINVSPDVLNSMRQYYCERAAEYDEWFNREGRYDRGPKGNALWWADVDVVRGALHECQLQGEVLELAPGTGIWTERLVESATHVTAVDGAPEMIAINRARVDSSRVTYHLADLFGWQPDRQYDAIFFGFWLSHVPHERLEWFARLVADCLLPGGKVFFVDSRPDPLMSAAEHVLPGAGEQVMVRRLNDGREFSIVKNFYEPDELEMAFARVGLEVNVRKSERFFIYGSGRKLMP